MSDVRCQMLEACAVRGAFAGGPVGVGFTAGQRTSKPRVDAATVLLGGALRFLATTPVPLGPTPQARNDSSRILRYRVRSSSVSCPFPTASDGTGFAWTDYLARPAAVFYVSGH